MPKYRFSSYKNRDFQRIITAEKDFNRRKIPGDLNIDFSVFEKSRHEKLLLKLLKAQNKALSGKSK